MLTSKQQDNRRVALQFVRGHVESKAQEWDREGHIPRDVLSEMSRAGLMGAWVDERDGGLGWDWLSFGLLCEQVGGASASLLSILTVHTMALQALVHWGTPEQKAQWLKPLARGETIGAFALTEPGHGSDAAGIETQATAVDSGYGLSGRKKWISYAQQADLFLVFGQCEKSPVALLVPRTTPGLSTIPAPAMLGFRSAGLGELLMDDCRIPHSAIVGRIGNGFSHIASDSLDAGRFCIAFGALGMIEACTRDSVIYARRKRKQFGVPLIQHQLIQAMIANMIAGAKSTRHLCYHAAELRQSADPDSILETTTAKYVASQTASRVANDAVQVHGALGCSEESRVERIFRDARITEIIEGSNQMQQLMIARLGAAEYLRSEKL